MESSDSTVKPRQGSVSFKADVETLNGGTDKLPDIPDDDFDVPMSVMGKENVGYTFDYDDEVEEMRKRTRRRSSRKSRDMDRRLSLQQLKHRGRIRPRRSSTASSISSADEDDENVTIPETDLPVPDSDEEEEEEEMQFPPLNLCQRMIVGCQKKVESGFSSHKSLFKRLFRFLLLLAFVVYFCVAMKTKFPAGSSIALLLGTLFVATFVAWEFLSERYRKQMARAWARNCGERKEKLKWRIRIALLFFLFLFILILLFGVFKIQNNNDNLKSGGGILAFIFLLFFFSKHPAHIRWDTVFVGFFMQFFMGVFVMRTTVGFYVFETIGNQTSIFLDYVEEGAKFVYGENFKDHFFAFKVMSIILYFSAFVALLYHLGLMLYIIKKIGWIMGKVVGTTAGESMVAAANIFIGQVEAPLIVKPFLVNMTRSELHSIMTSGFATVAGTVFGAYISFGANAADLITASCMAAPGSLAMAKLFYPETKRTKTAFTDLDVMDSESPYKNMLEAISAGASDAISLALNVAGNLLVFISMIAFIDKVLEFFGEMVNLPGLSMAYVLSYVFIPLSLIMGVEWADSRQIAKLIGLKTMINEFVAFNELGNMIKRRKYNEMIIDDFNLTSTNWTLAEVKRIGMETGKNVTLTPFNVSLSGDFISTRSEQLATFALCGFANLSSIGSVIGCLGAICPPKKRAITSCVLRAIIAGNVTCFVGASIAGLLYEPQKERQFLF